MGGGSQMGKSKYAMSGVVVRVHVRTMGEKGKMLPFWCVHTYRMAYYRSIALNDQFGSIGATYSMSILRLKRFSCNHTLTLLHDLKF